MGMPNKQTVRICERCQTRYLASADNIDFVHDCGNSPNEALQNEDVFSVFHLLPWFIDIKLFHYCHPLL